MKESRLFLEAPFDEKLSLLSLLTDALQNSFRNYGKEKELFSRIFQFLKNTKEGSAEIPVSQALEEEVKRQRKRMASLKEARMLSKKEESIRLQFMQMLGMFNASLKEEISMKDEMQGDNEAAFSFLKECFRKKEEERQEEIRKTGEMLSNALNFLGNTFGEGQELLLFLSEISKSRYALEFLSDIGNETYSRYNQYLLLKDKQKLLQEEAEQALRN